MVSDDPYLLPDANVLNNCFGEKNESTLQEYEIFFTGLRICELIDNPLSSFLDYDHLKRIHAFIFQDIYPSWAGTSRMIKIFKKEKLLKGKSVKYTLPGNAGSNIDDIAFQLFEKLQQDNNLKGLSRMKFCKRLSKFLSQIWQIHPFREGNTRSIMVICNYISQQAGYPFSLIYIDKMHRELRDSLVLSTIDKPERLQKFIFKSTTYKSRFGMKYWKDFFQIRNTPPGKNL